MQISVGNRAIQYQFIIDTQPPEVKSSFAWTNRLPSTMDPTAAANVAASSYTPKLAAWLNFSKPIRGLGLVSTVLDPSNPSHHFPPAAHIFLDPQHLVNEQSRKKCLAILPCTCNMLINLHLKRS